MISQERKSGVAVLHFCDEDLQMIGIDPERINDEAFERIIDGLREYYNTCFTDVLQDIVAGVLDGD
jgi:hypothetical protein